MNLITAAAGLSARLSPGLVAVLLAAAGIQTLRLADETTAHAQTKAQWAEVTLCRAAWPSDKGLNPAQNLTAP